MRTHKQQYGLRNWKKESDDGCAGYQVSDALRIGPLFVITPDSDPATNNGPFLLDGLSCHPLYYMRPTGSHLCASFHCDKIQTNGLGNGRCYFKQVEMGEVVESEAGGCTPEGSPGSPPGSPQQPGSESEGQGGAEQAGRTAQVLIAHLLDEVVHLLRRPAS